MMSVVINDSNDANDASPRGKTLLFCRKARLPPSTES
uniref:Uncharacterized protein n=1 Tax=Anguilla anguilla TaxID=7936 RepID=A0A0E9VJ71_ANGAN